MLEWAIAFLGKRNSGKTYNAAVLVEQLINSSVPVIVLDVMGIWWGLRVGVDKHGEPDPKRPGLPVVVIGGKHADIQLDPLKVSKIVEALLQTNTSAVLDVSQFRKYQQIQIATTFAEEVYRLADQYPAQRVVVCEETDQFAPQKPFRDEARCLGAFEDLVKLGGNRNICFIGISQRPASYNKNVLTQSDLLFIGRLTAPQDKAAIQAWVEKHAEENSKELREWYDTLSGLRKGQMWAWNDDEDWQVKALVQFGLRTTFHATRKFVLSKQAATVKLGDASVFIERFKDKFEPKPKSLPEVKIAHGPAKPELKAKRVIASMGSTRGTIQVEAKLIRPPRVPQPEPISNEPLAHLKARAPIARDQIHEPTLEANDREIVGQLLYVIEQGRLKQELGSNQVVEILKEYGWIHEKREVEEGLLKLCDWKFTVRKLQANKSWKYHETENAEGRIILDMVNQT